LFRYFLLSPYEEIKSTIQTNFSKGGQQGFRGDKINQTIIQMI